MRRRAFAGAAIAAALLWPDAARAQVHLGAWDGAIDAVVEVARQNVKTGGTSDAVRSTAFAQEQVMLRNTGISVYDPRFLRMSLGGTFGLSQERQSGAFGDSQEGTLHGYELFATLLGEQATSMNIFANRNQALITRELAGRNESVTENRGTTLFARRLPLPSTLTLRQAREEEESRSGDRLTRRDDQRNILTYEAQRGWEDRELSLRYEFVDLAAEVTPDLSYQSHESSLNLSSDFGPELNRRWDSQARLFSRTGQSDLTTLTVDEALRVEHSERLQSEGRYLLLYTETAGQSSTTHTATLQLQHQLYESLRSTVGGDASFLTLSGGEEGTLRARLDSAYTKRLPAGGLMHAGLGGRLEYQDNQFDTVETFVPQETHTFASPNALPVTLDHAQVDSSSIVVTKVSLGPLPAGCFTPSGPPVPLVLGRDYTLLPVGNAVQLAPIVCSGATPGINPGDTIAVNYRFTVSPAIGFLTDAWRMDVNLDYRWIRPYAAHQQSSQHLLSGLDQGFLDDQTSDAVGLELRSDHQSLHAQLVNEVSRFTSGRVSYDRLRSTQFASYSVAPNATLSATTEEGWIDYSNPEHQTQTLSAQADFTYSLQTQVLLEAALGTRWLGDTLLPDERHTEASLRLRWFLRRLEVSPRVDWFDRERDQTETQEYRFLVHVIRRF